MSSSSLHPPAPPPSKVSAQLLCFITRDRAERLRGICLLEWRVDGAHVACSDEPSVRISVYPLRCQPLVVDPATTPACTGTPRMCCMTHQDTSVRQRGMQSATCSPSSLPLRSSRPSLPHKVSPRATHNSACALARWQSPRHLALKIGAGGGTATIRCPVYRLKVPCGASSVARTWHFPCCFSHGSRAVSRSAAWRRVDVVEHACGDELHRLVPLVGLHHNRQ